MLRLLVEGLIYFKRFLAFLFLCIFKVLYFIVKLLFRIFGVKIYKSYFFIKKRINKTYLPATSKFFYPFTGRYLIHVVIILIALGTATASLSAYEVRTEAVGGPGEKSILYSLIRGEDEMMMEEEMEEGLPESVVSSYLADEELLGAEYHLGIPGGELIEETEVATSQDESAILKPQIPTTTVNLKLRDGIIEYAVEGGDTISSIAEKFGISVNTILWANDLSAYSIIRPGNTLKILPTSGILHKVASGDTLDKIAKKYSVEVEKIREANKLTEVSTISKGQQLIIPGGKKAYTAPVTTSRYSSATSYFVPPSAQVPSTDRMFWPSSCRRITQYYKWSHHAIDIGCSYGTPIYAAEAGIVEYSGWSTGYGYNILINHGGGRKTRYGHFSKLYVSKGQSVVKGQTIGAEGSTGWSTGPHLHFEVIINGVKVNPFNYVR